MIADKTTMLEKISLLTNNGFFKSIYFAGLCEKPDGENVQISSSDRLICTLAGCQKIFALIGTKFTKLELNKGDVLYCPRHVWIKYDWKVPHEMISILFGIDCIRAIYINHKGKTDFPPVDYYYHTDHPFIHSGMLLIHSLNEMNNDPSFQESALSILGAVIKMTIIQIEQSSEYNEESKARMTWREVSRYLSEHATENIGRDQIANYFGLNPDYITRLFKRFSQMTFQNYLDEMRMQLAEKLVMQKKFKIQNIAKQCGYNSCSYFIRRFRKYYKMSPEEFRNSIPSPSSRGTSVQERLLFGTQKKFQCYQTITFRLVSKQFHHTSIVLPQPLPSASIGNSRRSARKSGSRGLEKILRRCSTPQFTLALTYTRDNLRVLDAKRTALLGLFYPFQNRGLTCHTDLL